MWGLSPLDIDRPCIRTPPLFVETNSVTRSRDENMPLKGLKSPLEALFMQKHPDVLAKYERRILADPDTCHYPYGAVSATAAKPRPQWCVRPVGHNGGHADAAREERERQRHAKNQAAYRERQKLKIGNGKW